jgi:hypothetical protein
MAMTRETALIIAKIVFSLLEAIGSLFFRRPSQTDSTQSNALEGNARRGFKNDIMSDVIAAASTPTDTNKAMRLLFELNKNTGFRLPSTLGNS